MEPCFVWPDLGRNYFEKDVSGHLQANRRGIVIYYAVVVFNRLYM